MRMLATLDVPTSGNAYICGHSIIDHPDRVRRFLGYMPDSFGKYANMTVEDYLDFFARSYGLRGQARRDAVNHVLVFTELRKLQHKSIKALSKGMSQRLGLGRTLIHNPQLLILDEPGLAWIREPESNCANWFIFWPRNWAKPFLLVRIS